MQKGTGKLKKKCNNDKPNREETKEEGDNGVVPIEQRIYVALKWSSRKT